MCYPECSFPSFYIQVTNVVKQELLASLLGKFPKPFGVAVKLVLNELKVLAEILEHL